MNHIAVVEREMERNKCKSYTIIITVFCEKEGELENSVNNIAVVQREKLV